MARTFQHIGFTFLIINLSFQDTSLDLSTKIEKSCKLLNSGSTVFHLKDCNKLLKNQDVEGTDLEITCEELLIKMGSGQDKMSNSYGHGKGKGKQKSGKITSSANAVNVKVQFTTFLLLVFT